MNWKHYLTISLLGAGAVVGGSMYLKGCSNKDVPNPAPIAAKSPEKKDDPVNLEARVEPKAEPKVEPKAEPKPEPKVEPKAEPKAEPKVEPKPEPKPEPPKWEAKEIVYESSVKYDHPVNHARGMEYFRVLMAYRKIKDGKHVDETALMRIYLLGEKSGDDDIIQKKEIGIPELKEEVEALRKEHGKEYKELDMAPDISDKVEDKAYIGIMPENEAQDKRLMTLKEMYKTPKQKGHLAVLIKLKSNNRKISDERISYVENEMAKDYGGKK